MKINSGSVKDPKVTVIIPVFNTELYLRDALDSIANQTLKEIEIICVNDGSTDGSLKIISKYAEGDSRFTVISQTNRGLSHARNAGLSSASGEYVYFFDSDDLLDLSSLSELYNTAKKDDLDAIYFDATTIYENYELEMKFPVFANAYSCKVVLPNIYNGFELFCKLVESGSYKVIVGAQLIKREYIKKIDLTFVEGIIHEDNLFNLKCILQARKVRQVNFPYFHRRVRTSSIMTQEKKFNNLYGYLVSFAGMMSFSNSLPYNKDLFDALSKVLATYPNSICNIYKSINQEELEKIEHMNRMEKLWLSLCLPESQKVKKPKTSSLGTYNEAALLRGSWSYRIGRFITWLPRKVRGGVRCYRDHGLKFTLHLAMKKIFC